MPRGKFLFPIKICFAGRVDNLPGAIVWKRDFTDDVLPRLLLRSTGQWWEALRYFACQQPGLFYVEINRPGMFLFFMCPLNTPNRGDWLLGIHLIFPRGAFQRTGRYGNEMLRRLRCKHRSSWCVIMGYTVTLFYILPPMNKRVTVLDRHWVIVPKQKSAAERKLQV